MPTNATSTGAAPISRPTRVGDARGVALAVEQVIAGDAGLADQPLEQVPAEAGGMIDGQADVLVEMKQLDPRPVDAGRRGERVEELELRRAGRGDDPRDASRFDRVASARAACRAAARLMVGDRCRS